MWKSEDRFYEIGGEKLPSVTTILSVIDKSGPLMGWAIREERRAIKELVLDTLTNPNRRPDLVSPEDIWKLIEESIPKVRESDKLKEEAANIGKEAHALIDWQTKKMMGMEVGPEPQAKDEAINAFLSWLDWVKQVNLKPLRSEFVVHEKDIGFAGTADLLADIGGKLILCDYKTSKAIWPEHRLQIIAYRRALENMGTQVDKLLILRLPKVIGDPTFEPVEISEEEEDYLAFLSAKRLWEWKHKNGTR